MDCSQLIASFTDYIDGSAPSDVVRAMEAHLVGCDSCRRYKAVLEHGSSLLQTLPSAELREDFAPRLQHRLYHVQEERTLSDHVTSGAPALTVLGIAVLLTVVAWAPTLRATAPLVELEPIVVDRAPLRLRVAPAGLLQVPRPRPETEDKELDADLWDDARLYEYSQLRRRYPGDAQARQVGFAPTY
ncbi:MAG: zf-HC2 domain-containing protein [Gemmatimonadota bacterium]|nr:zf-HC2 domain-containing protein [Gemmatimonadota bacterium]MDH3421478.1 zf-HC2 domain-containing protein [Gemmatimonadota bacterium]